MKTSPPQGVRREVLAAARELVMDIGNGTVAADDLETKLQHTVNRSFFPVERSSLERAVAWRSKHLGIALGVLALAIVVAFMGQSPALRGFVYLVLFGEWIWLTVIFVRASSMKDHAKETAVRWRQELLEEGLTEARRIAHERVEAIERDRLAERIERGTPPPPPQPFGVSHEGAEAIVAVWMQHLGAVDASVTRFSGDGGIDVESANYVAQVKNYVGSVGVAEVREIAGVALVDGRQPLFFTSGTYATGAVEFADRARIALFIYDAVEGTLIGANKLGRDAVQIGLEPPEL